MGENVRQALQFTESGNADVALVALTLAMQAENGQWTIVPAHLHNPLDQTMAVVSSSKRQADARRFIDLVSGPQGRNIMRKYGFIIPGQDFAP
jgi:molybdate transport system substrate-binding protein